MLVIETQKGEAGCGLSLWLCTKKRDYDLFGEMHVLLIEENKMESLCSCVAIISRE